MLTEKQIEEIRESAIDSATAAISAECTKTKAENCIYATSEKRGMLLSVDKRKLDKYINMYIIHYEDETFRLAGERKYPEAITIRGLSINDALNYSRTLNGNHHYIIDNCDINDLQPKTALNIKNSYIRMLSQSQQENFILSNCTIDNCQNTKSANFEFCKIGVINALSDTIFTQCNIGSATNIIDCKVTSSEIEGKVNASSGKLTMHDCEVKGDIVTGRICTLCKLVNVKATNINVQGEAFTGENCSGKISIKSVTIQLKNSATVEELTVEKCANLEIHNCTIKGETSVNNCKFSKHAIFSDTIFNAAPIIDADTKFSSKNVEFSNCIFKPLQGGTALGAYRSLKSLCQDADYEHGAILFHGLELETYYNTHLTKEKWADWLWPTPRKSWKNWLLLKPNKDMPEKAASIFHWALTDYGRDIMRPFLWLILLFFLAADFYVGLNKLDIIGFENLNSSSSLLLSFKNSVGPMAFALNSDYWKDLPQPDPDFFGFLHIITSSLIWFLIIFMIRRRFKI